MGKDLCIGEIGKLRFYNYYMSTVLKLEGLLINKQMVRYEEIAEVKYGDKKKSTGKIRNGSQSITITLKNGKSFIIKGHGIRKNLNPNFERFYSKFKEIFQLKRE